MQKLDSHIVMGSPLLRSYAILLLLLYAFIILKPVSPYVDYLLRREYIINNLCINQEIPEKQCNGKCHLEKQLVKEVEDTEGENIPPPPQNERRDLQEYLIAGQKGIVPVRKEMPALPEYQGFYTYQYVPSIFHPPMEG